MNSKIIAPFHLLLILLPIQLLGQNPPPVAKTHRFGVLFTKADDFTLQDKVLDARLARLWSFGLSYTNKKKEFIAFFGIGIKGAKLNFYPAGFRSSFIQDVKQHYKQKAGTGEDSLIGFVMTTDNSVQYLQTYSSYFHAGFVLNTRYRPALNLYYGSEEFILHNNGFSQYEDPKNHDINYVGMSTVFYEVKLGCAISIKKFAESAFALYLNAGYKWVDYGALQFSNTPLNSYTDGGLPNKYRWENKLSLSLSFVIWTNW
jgi:hypothetical protein